MMIVLQKGDRRVTIDPRCSGNRILVDDNGRPSTIPYENDADREAQVLEQVKLRFGLGYSLSSGSPELAHPVLLWKLQSLETIDPSLLQEISSTQLWSKRNGRVGSAYSTFPFEPDAIINAYFVKQGIGSVDLLTEPSPRALTLSEVRGILSPHGERFPPDLRDFGVKHGLLRAPITLPKTTHAFAF